MPSNLYPPLLDVRYDTPSISERNQQYHSDRDRREPPTRQESPSLDNSDRLFEMGDHRHQDEFYKTFAEFEGLDQVSREDARLKALIRRLRLISRIAATIISIGVLVPITLTVQKFLSTKDVFRIVVKPDGTATNRNPWFKDSKTWPTYMYFAVAVVSTLLNFGVLVSYLRGSIAGANKTAYVSSIFTWVVMLGNLIVWCVAAALYRSEKATDDLWGWACSDAAKLIQREFADQIDFGESCNVQSASWYVGLAQVAAAAVTVFTYYLVLRRRKTKKTLKKRMSQQPGQYPSDY